MPPSGAARLRTGERMEPLWPDDPREAGEFRLRARLGAGGMGQVYLGMSPAGRAVAVKIVRPELTQDAEFIGRFRSEVAAAKAVNGVYTAQVVATGLYDNPPWLATVYIPGPTLEQVVDERGPLPEPAIWRLAAGLAEALRAVHGAGLVHRDLKPNNVLLAEDGPRVIDFGVARALDAASRTSTGVTMGTPPFMSPEQAEGSPAGPASDVFSLGSVLCFAATGEPPFGDGSAPSVLYRVVHAAPALGAVAEPLRGLIGSCLAKDPALRPAVSQLTSSLAARPEGWDGTFWPAGVAAVIREYGGADARQLGYQTWHEPGRRVTSVPPVAGPAPTTGSPTDTDRPPHPPSSRRRALAIFGGVAAAGLAVGAWQLSGDGKQSRTPAGLTGDSGGAYSGTGGKVLWHHPVPSRPEFLAMTNGGVYVATYDAGVFALDAATGKLDWTHVRGAEIPNALTASDGTVYWTAENVIAVDAASGSVRWQHVPTSVVGLFTVSGGSLIYAAAGNGGPALCDLIALDTATGRVRWQVPCSSYPTASAGADGVMYVAMNQSHMFALGPDGRQLWAKPDQVGLVPVSLAVSDGVLFGCGTYASEGFLVFALSAASGDTLWQSHFPGVTGLGIDGATAIYGGTGAGVQQRNLRTGTLGWQRSFGHDVTAGPVVVNGAVLVGVGPTVYALSAGTGKILWQRSVSATVTGIATDGAVVSAGTAYWDIYGLQL
jgi:serine/threonine protein kinase/outer membrane protein assembly factor BamB